MHSLCNTKPKRFTSDISIEIKHVNPKDVMIIVKNTLFAYAVA